MTLLRDNLLVCQDSVSWMTGWPQTHSVAVDDLELMIFLIPCWQRLFINFLAAQTLNNYT